MGQTQRLSFRVNEEYDSELLEYLAGVKNRSKEIRKIIRLGLKVLSDKSSDKSQGQQKNQLKKLIWKL